MKKLIVFRHGKSSWDNVMQKDIKRPLNERGKSEVPFMSKILLDYKVNPDLIMVSPATRTKETAESILNITKWDTDKIIYKDDLYMALAGELTDIMRKVDNKAETLMFVGHNPGMTQMANQFTNVQIDNMPTSSFCIIQFDDISNWKDIVYGVKGTLTAFEYPKKY
jgi:phosphohistidine phosphatase